MELHRRIVITGVGVVSPVGNSKEKFWDSLVKGVSGVRLLKAFDPSRFSSHVAAEVLDFDPALYLSAKELRRTDRFVQFAIGASKMCINDSKINLEKVDKNRFGVLIGSGIGGLHTIEREAFQYIEKGPSRITPLLIPMLIVNMATGQVSILFGLKGPSSAVATACATGNHAIGDAFKIIQRGDADIMMCGGTEGAITPLGFGGFCALKALTTRNDAPEKACRPFDKERDGFIMGEGAGIVLLEELEHAKGRKAHIYAEMIGYGMSGDGYHMTAPDPTGDGAVRCMQACLKDANIKPEDVDYINAHGTSTELNDKIETLAIKKVFGKHAYKIAISSTKSMTGHLLGAAGGVEFIASSLAIKEEIIPPTINQEVPDPECDLDYVPNKARKQKINIAISNAFGFGGHNATLALKRY